MSLESVIEDIREQARAEAEEIRSSAEEEAEQIIDDAEAEAKSIIDDATQEAEQEARQLREQRLSSAKLEAKQTRLKARREVLDEVREKVTDRLASLEGDDRRDLTATLLESAVDEFDAGEDLIVHGSDGDEELLASLTSDDDQLSVGDPVDRIGGVVVEGTTTKMRVDNSFDSILNEIWGESLRSISDELFQE